jgi:hypothetical protein
MLTNLLNEETTQAMFMCVSWVVLSRNSKKVHFPLIFFTVPTMPGFRFLE